MAKICKSCGKEYTGDFCEHCGYGNPNLKVKSTEKYKKTTTPVRFMTPEQKEAYYAELKAKELERRRSGKKKKRDPKQIRLLIIVIIAVAVLVFGTLFGSGVIGFSEDSTDVVIKYFDAINERDFDDYVSCFPKEMKADYKDDLEQTGYTKDEYMEAFNADFAEEYGDDFTLEYEIVDIDTITEYSFDGYEEAYGVTPDISDANIVSVDVTFSGSLGSDTYRMDCYVGKVGRHWKMFNMEYNAGVITTDMEIEDPDQYSSGEDDEDSSGDSSEEDTADSTDSTDE